MASFGMDLQEMAGVLEAAFSTVPISFQREYLVSPRMRIEAGTDEILRNVIAERVLGLPGDIRVDREPRFVDVPSGRHGR